MHWIFVTTALAVTIFFIRRPLHTGLFWICGIAALIAGSAILWQLWKIDHYPEPASLNPVPSLYRDPIAITDNHLWLYNAEGELVILNKETLKTVHILKWPSKTIRSLIQLVSDGKRILVATYSDQGMSWALASAESGWIIPPAKDDIKTDLRLNAYWDAATNKFTVVATKEASKIHQLITISIDQKNTLKQSQWKLDRPISGLISDLCPHNQSLLVNYHWHDHSQLIRFDPNNHKAISENTASNKLSCPGNIRDHSDSKFANTGRDVTNIFPPAGLYTYIDKFVIDYRGGHVKRNFSALGNGADSLEIFADSTSVAKIRDISYQEIKTRALPPKDYVEIVLTNRGSDKELHLPLLERDLRAISGLWLLEHRIILFGDGGLAIFNRHTGERIDQQDKLRIFRAYTAQWGGYSVIFEIWLLVAILAIAPLILLLALYAWRPLLRQRLVIGIAFIECCIAYALIVRVFYL